ncbi:MAG: nucleotidyltransferase domain-containing protein, partial [Pseudomonadota bacterium]
LYGSCARGDNRTDSDMDVFIVSDSPEKVRKHLSRNKKLQTVIKKRSELLKFRKENSEFYKEVKQGITTISNYEKTL